MHIYATCMYGDRGMWEIMVCALYKHNIMHEHDGMHDNQIMHGRQVAQWSEFAGPVYGHAYADIGQSIVIEL